MRHYRQRQDRRCTMTVIVNIKFPGFDDEVYADVSYSVTPYHPATYDDPAEGGEIEDIEVTRLWSETIRTMPSTVYGEKPVVDRIITELDRPQWLVDLIVDNVDKADLYEAAADDTPDEPDPDDLRDRMIDDRMTEGRF